MICFRGRYLGSMGRHLQQAVNTIRKWATRNKFRFAAIKCSSECLNKGGNRNTSLMLYQATVYSNTNALCMAQHQIQNYDKWKANGSRLVFAAFSLQHLHRGQRSSFMGTSVEVIHAFLSVIPALTIQHIIFCMNWAKPQAIYMPQAKWKRRYDPLPRPVPRSGLKIRAIIAEIGISVLLEDTWLSSFWETRIWSNET